MIKKVLNEFKNFAMRGNAIDMAIGIIIGTAFGKIVDSLVKDIIMPPICILLGKIDLDSFFFVLKRGEVPEPYASLITAKQAGAVTINYGTFINTIMNFFIVSVCVFLLIKLINISHLAMKGATTTCPYCCSTVSVQASRCPNCTSSLSTSSDLLQQN